MEDGAVTGDDVFEEDGGSLCGAKSDEKGLLPVNGSEEEEDVEGVETEDGPARRCLLRGVEPKPELLLPLAPNT